MFAFMFGRGDGPAPAAKPVQTRLGFTELERRDNPFIDMSEIGYGPENPYIPPPPPPPPSNDITTYSCVRGTPEYHAVWLDILARTGQLPD